MGSEALAAEPDEEILVSVIIPAFKQVQLLNRSVSSVLAQTHRCLEVIVVDDASAEDVMGVLSGFDDKRLSYYRLERNQGVAAARNLGISHSKGRYVAFLDSDDDWTENKIEAQLARLRLRGADHRACYTMHGMIDDANGKTMGFSKYNREGDLLGDLLFKTRMALSSLIVERDLLLEVHGFDERIRMGQDWELYLRLAQHSLFAYVGEPLTRYHMHPGQISRTYDRNKVFVESLSIILQKHRDLFQRDRKALAGMLTLIGHYQAGCGQKKEARNSFLSAIRYHPMQKAAYVSLARLVKGWK